MNKNTLGIGSTLPTFQNIRGVDGKKYAQTDFTNQILIIVFSCNHCPYVQAYEDRMMQLQRDYRQKDVQLVAINSNDERNYPDDSFEKMVERAEKQAFNFPYLRDQEQKVAESFGATHTPQFFLFNGKRTLRYSGNRDDNWKEPDLVKERYLRDAIDALLLGNEIKIQETFSIGCTIKWK